MKTIGFIDYYIDEWHSNNYPKFIADTEYGDAFKVTMASEVAPHPERRPLEQWCREMNIAQAHSPEEVVDNCDCILVLAPNNSEQHEALAAYALASGKPVYIDKTFAPTLAAARRLFERADQYHTPLMSTSALRYARSVLDCATPGDCRYFCGFGGGLWFDVYAVHQVEMMVALCGLKATRVMVNAAGTVHTAEVLFEDQKIGRINYDPAMPGFRTMRAENNDFKLDVLDGDPYFKRLMSKIMEFFMTGRPSVPREQTCAVIAILEAIYQGIKTPGVWINVPR